MYSTVYEKYTWNVKAHSVPGTLLQNTYVIWKHLHSQSHEWEQFSCIKYIYMEISIPIATWIDVYFYILITLKFNHRLNAHMFNSYREWLVPNRLGGQMGTQWLVYNKCFQPYMYVLFICVVCVSTNIQCSIVHRIKYSSNIYPAQYFVICKTTRVLLLVSDGYTIM